MKPSVNEAVELAYKLFGEEDWLENIRDGITWTETGTVQPVLIFRIIDLEEAIKGALPHFIDGFPVVVVWKL